MTEHFSSSWDFVYSGTRQAGPGIIADLLNSRGPVAIDIETPSLTDRRIIGVGFATDPDNAYFIRRDSPYMPISMLEDPHILKIFHNAEFDIPALESHFGIRVNNYTDTIVAAHIAGLPPKLSALADMFLGVFRLDIKQLLEKYQATDMLGVPVPEIAQKCAYDVRDTWEIFNLIMKRGLVSREALDLDVALIPVLRRIENRGMGIDEKRLEEHRVRITRDRNFYRSVANGIGFNPGSNTQLEPLMRAAGLPIQYGKPGPVTGKRQPKFNKEIMEAYPYNENPTAVLARQYRMSAALLSHTLKSCYEKLYQGRMYFRLQQTAAASGRISTSPNVQNWTPELRDIVVPADGNILEVGDFSQIELRVLNYFAKDPTMDEVFRLYDSGQGPSIHRVTQHTTVDPYSVNPIETVRYRIAKNVNFTVIYLGDEYTLRTKYGIPLEQGAMFRYKYFKTYPGVYDYLASKIRFLHKEGYAETLLGRKRYFPELLDPGAPKWKKDKAVREGINHEIQGTAGEINKRALIMMDGDPVTNNVHDETVTDRDMTAKIHWPGVDELAPFATPIEVHTGKNWVEAKP